jgi:hypothetical protein
MVEILNSWEILDDMREGKRELHWQVEDNTKLGLEAAGFQNVV